MPTQNVDRKLEISAKIHNKFYNLNIPLLIVLPTRQQIAKIMRNDCADYKLYLEAKCPWINKCLFKELIESNNLSKNVTVETYSLEPAVPKGQNCQSEVIRARVIYTIESVSQKEINFVIKILKSDFDVAIKHNEMFLREIAVFREILPRAEQLLRSINDETKISPKCYLTDSEKFYLIFEDLVADGYKMHSKKIGLTFENYKSAYSTLAKWHATTAVLFCSEPSIMKPFEKPIFTKYHELKHQSVTIATAKLARGIPTLENVSKKLENLSSSILVKVKESLKLCPNDFNCLNHNDLWTNNIMFNDTTNSALLVDFQLAYLGSPIMDITKSLFTSSHNDIRREEFDELLLHYHNELSLTLTKLLFNNVPSLNHLEEQLKIRGICSMTSGLYATASRHLEDSSFMYAQFCTQNSDAKTIDLEILTIPEAQERLLFLIKYFEDLGYFDS